jgi:hypothetical protein
VKYGIIAEDVSDINTLKVIIKRLSADASCQFIAKGYKGCRCKPTDFIGGPLLDSSSLAFTADFQYRLNPVMLFNFGVAQSHDRTDRVRNQFNYSFDLSAKFT